MAKKEKKRKKKDKVLGKADFIRRQLLSNHAIPPEEIKAAWDGLFPEKPLSLKTIRREQTEFKKLQGFNQQKGFIDFFSTQTALLLAQYKNIEQLLGPPGANWTWPGEHCEVLLRDAIQKVLPSSYRVGKGYIHGIATGPEAIERCPEIDILVYNHQLFAPIFSMGDFVIVYPESVVAAIQVKRTLDAATLVKAVENVVKAKRHVFNRCRLNGAMTAEKMFSAVVGFEDSVSDPSLKFISKSFETAIRPWITNYSDATTLPDFIGSMSTLFLAFTGINSQQMGYQGFPSTQDNQHLALAMLLFLLMKKLQPFGLHMPGPLPEKMNMIGYVGAWKLE